jgi:Tol biopolymer transport system component
MSLTSGTRIGPYEVIAPLGSGGMGEVWKARDARLARDVAIKILPDGVAADADRLRRFEQEAQAAAALNHPNILAVYDVGTLDRQPYIISELLEGETLRDRLSSAAGALPARKAIEYAVQLAHGLAAAHQKGIVHRDLKPENVFIDSSGRVKILDFGLAKLTERDSPVSAMSVLPTKAPDTVPGVVMGTIGYMSPEQVRGQQADHRADIFALGTVLYEMLSGRRAFRRDTTIDTMTAILKEDPPDLPVADGRIPPGLARIVDRCLDKNPAGRFHSAEDLAFALDSLSSASGDARTIAINALPRRASAHIAWTVAAVLGVVALAAGTWAAAQYRNRAPVDAPTLRYSISPPEGGRLALTTNPGAPTPIVVAPDGRSLAFVARRGGVDTIWIQPLDALTPHPLAGTEGASSVFWSPDSRYLGFFADAKIKKVDVTGGPPTTLSDSPGGAGGTWNPANVILFNSGRTGLKKVSAGGGAPTDATTLGTGEQAHFRPWMLPDGRHFLYTVYPQDSVSRLPIYVGALDSADAVRIGESSATNVMYSQGHLLFMREATLVAQPFDLDRLSLNGEAFPVADGVERQGAEPHQGVFSVSQNGVLVYLKQGAAALSQLTWLTRAGKPLASVGDPGLYTEVSLSHDEKRAVVSLSVTDLWTMDLARGLRTRFTFDQAVHYSPRWSSNDEQIVFAKSSTGLLQKPSDGAEPETLVLPAETAVTIAPTDWSSDGQYLLFVKLAGARAASDVWVWSSGKAVPLLAMPFDETDARFSPDGRWVAYVSNESGRNEVYVVPFIEGSGTAAPTLGRGKWPVSSGGGILPRWRQDGRELFYFEQANGRLMAAPVTGQPSAFEVGAAQPLFPVRPSGGTGMVGAVQRSFYDVSRDGQRFLVNAEPSESQIQSSPATVVVNWLSGRSK